jgi:dihydroxyacetone kinase-like protein
MKKLAPADLLAILRAIASRLREEKDTLCDLDGEIGDGDHGTTMAQGFEAVAAAISDLDIGRITLADVFTTCARSFLDAVGATTGPLYASAFLHAAEFTANRTELPAEEAPLILCAFAEGIAHRGKARVGDKTMLDVWMPVCHRVQSARSSGEPLTELLPALTQIAEKGVEATMAMVASRGRSARLGERSLGHKDPGAASAAIIVACFTQTLQERIAG